MDWKKVDWAAYEERVAAYEAEGMTRSDAQGIVDMELADEQAAEAKKKSSNFYYR